MNERIGNAMIVGDILDGLPWYRYIDDKTDADVANAVERSLVAALDEKDAERDAAKHESYMDRCRGDNLFEEVVRLRKIEATTRKNRNDGLHLECLNGCLSPGSEYVCTLCALDAALAESAT